MVLFVDGAVQPLVLVEEPMDQIEQEVIDLQTSLLEISETDVPGSELYFGVDHVQKTFSRVALVAKTQVSQNLTRRSERANFVFFDMWDPSNEISNMDDGGAREASEAHPADMDQQYKYSPRP